MVGTASQPEGRHRLWIINHYAATGEQAGGSRHLDLARSLCTRGWDTEIFACSFDHVTRQYSVATSWRHPVVSTTVDGVEFHWVHATAYHDNSWRRYLNMLWFSIILLVYCLRRRRPDVILGSSAHLLAPFVGWILSQRYRSVCVVEVRDLWPDSLIQLGMQNRRVIAVLRWMERFLYAHADLLVGVSQGIVDGIVRNGGDPAKTILVSHGIETNPERQATLAARNDIRADLGWSDDFVVLWAGSMEPFNGLDIVVEGARELAGERDLRVVLLGGGSEQPRLAELARDLPNVNVVPSVPRNEAFRWMVAADAGLIVAREFAAFTGTRPRKIFDYMAAGLPILCFVPGEASAIVAEAGAGRTHDWVTPQSFAAEMRWCLAHRQEVRELGEHGRLVVETRWALDASVDELLAGIEPLMPRKDA